MTIYRTKDLRHVRGHCRSKWATDLKIKLEAFACFSVSGCVCVCMCARAFVCICTHVRKRKARTVVIYSETRCQEVWDNYVMALTKNCLWKGVCQTQIFQYFFVCVQCLQGSVKD